MKSLIKFVKFILLVYGICLLNGCKDNQQEGRKPDPIAEYTITPIHGGAAIAYTIPTDPHIMYVMAEYERNGKLFTERSSIYKNSITIEGFNTTDPVSAIVYTVSRNETKSDPIIVEFVPLESIVSLARKTTDIYPTFGGIIVSWENASRTELGVRLMVDSLGTLIEKEMYFSSRNSEKHPFRGFESIETSFVLTYEDKWGNISDTVYYVGTPFFEVEVPKPWTDVRAMIPFDNVTSMWDSYLFSFIWDGSAASEMTRWITESGSKGSSFTFDLRQVVKLSRMTMWPYVEQGRGVPEGIYGQIHILEFEMWGTKALDPSKLPPADTTYWLHPIYAAKTNQVLPSHTFMDDWVYLGRHAVTRLDLMGVSDDDIFAAGYAGHQFDIPIECEPVRYIRFFPIATLTSSPPANNFWQVPELSFYGDNTIPQD